MAQYQQQAHLLRKKISPGETSAPVTNYNLNGSPFITIRHRMNEKLAKGWIYLIDQYNDMLAVTDEWNKLSYAIKIAMTAEQKKQALDAITQAAMNTFCIHSFDQLISLNREDDLVACRQMLMFIEHRLFGIGCKRVGKKYKRNHATVLHSCKIFQQSLHYSYKHYNKYAVMISFLLEEIFPEAERILNLNKKNLAEIVETT